MSAVGSKIRTVDYNSVQTKISSLIGIGSGNIGWGQSLSSSQVATTNKITVNEWANLRYDIINGARHIYGGNPAVAEAALGNIVKFDNSGTTAATATEPVIQYDRWADQLIANRFTVHPTQATTVNKGSQSRTDSWSSSTSCTITVTFTDAAQARYFFNSGGQVRITSSRTGGSTSTQNTSWTNLLNSAGTRLFGAQLPTTGFSPLTGQNYYRLTSTYQQWYTISGSGPYAVNTYRISAKSRGVVNNSAGTANIIDFLVEWIDDYADPFPEFSPFDVVDGTLSVSVSTLESSGTLVPATSGNFTVESPLVTYSTISGNSTDFYLTISSNQTNVNLRSTAVAAGWNQSTRVVAVINSGVVISGNTQGNSTAALTIDGSWPGGVELINHGIIVGRGGNGGTGESVNSSTYLGITAGSTAGRALQATTSVSIRNRGIIAGGGGGGGGGAAKRYFDAFGQYRAGGGGGGGGKSSLVNSTGGSGGTTSGSTSGSFGSGLNRNGSSGEVGSFDSAGAGGSPGSTSSADFGGSGGGGGNWGIAGASGNESNFYDRPDLKRLGAAGGAAGQAVSGNSNITWLATGSRQGPIV